MKIRKYLILTIIILLASALCFAKTPVKKAIKKPVAKKTIQKKTTPKAEPKPNTKIENSSQPKNHNIYLAFSALPISIEGFENSDFTDFYDDKKQYQYIANEGRIFLNSENLNQQTYLYGCMLGYKYVYNKLGFSIDVNFHTTNDIYLLSSFLGFEYRFITNQKYYIGLSPKIGYSMLLINYGPAEMAAGYADSTVLFKNGKPVYEIKSGDSIYLYSHAPTFQLFFTSGYSLGANLEIFGNIGISFTKYNNTQFYINNNFIKFNSEQFVNHMSYSSFNESNKIQSIGAIINIGAAIKL